MRAGILYVLWAGKQGDVVCWFQLLPWSDYLGLMFHDTGQMDVMQSYQSALGFRARLASSYSQLGCAPGYLFQPTYV